MPSDALYEKLAEAYSRPSQTAQTIQSLTGGINQAAEGYLLGKELREKERKRRLQQQTLAEALGGSVPPELEYARNLTAEEVSPFAPLLKDIGGFSEAEKQRRLDERQARNQAAIAERQKRQHEFIRSMVGAKGNKEAVNQAKNAVQGLGYIDDLWDRIDKLSTLQKAGAANPVLEKFYPEINTLKKNIRRTAGFSEGGKNLTEHELNIVVDSFEPTTFDNPASRQIKKKIARDFYSGTIDMYDAANLLGPAGAKLKSLADSIKARQETGQKMLNAELNQGVGTDINDLFDQVGAE